MTQENLAHAAGVTVATLARVETGATNPTWTTITQIASALEVSIEELGRHIDRVRRDDD